MKSIYILDACALIAYLSDEKGADLVERHIWQAAKGVISVIMSKITLLEVYYGYYRERGEAFANEMRSDISQSEIKIIDTFSDMAFLEAGRLKATYKMSLADSIVLGEAVARGATVLTSDHHEFDAVEQGESIKFEWIR